jgi:hypothetical protein
MPKDRVLADVEPPGDDANREAVHQGELDQVPLWVRADVALWSSFPHGPFNVPKRVALGHWPDTKGERNHFLCKRNGFRTSDD